MLSVSNFFVEHLLGRRGAFHSIGLEVQGQLCRSRFSPSIMWVLEMKLTFPGLAASAFPTEASCEPVSQFLRVVLASLLSTAWDDQRIEDFPLLGASLYGCSSGVQPCEEKSHVNVVLISFRKLRFRALPLSFLLSYVEFSSQLLHVALF